MADNSSREARVGGARWLQWSALSCETTVAPRGEKIERFESRWGRYLSYGISTEIPISLPSVATLLPRRATPARESGPPHPLGGPRRRVRAGDREGARSRQEDHRDSHPAIRALGEGRRRHIQVAQDVNNLIRAHDKQLGAVKPSYDAVIDFEPAVVGSEQSRMGLAAGPHVRPGPPEPGRVQRHRQRDPPERIQLTLPVAWDLHPGCEDTHVWPVPFGRSRAGAVNGRELYRGERLFFLSAPHRGSTPQASLPPTYPVMVGRGT